MTSLCSLFRRAHPGFPSIPALFSRWCACVRVRVSVSPHHHHHRRREKFGRDWMQSSVRLPEIWIGEFDLTESSQTLREPSSPFPIVNPAGRLRPDWYRTPPPSAGPGRCQWRPIERTTTPHRCPRRNVIESGPFDDFPTSSFEGGTTDMWTTCLSLENTLIAPSALKNPGGSFGVGA